MPGIFISYRRADSSGWVTAIYRELVRHYAPEQIFRDIDTIDFGVDFVEELNKAVRQCDVLLAIIGPQWSTITDQAGRRRLDNPNDFVRLEIAAALERDIRVIPVLVGGAAMPYASELPEDLQPLSRRNALEIGDRDFDHHVERLVRALQRALGVAPPRARIARSARPALPSVTDLLPRPFAWCDIPAGAVEIKDEDDDHGWFDVPAFKIAKYPITNAQYQVFVDAENGYRDPRWWEFSDHAIAWRAGNAQPRDTAFEGDDLPRTDVTWYEAVAFCRWLSAQTGEDITLPTEQQWQRAAQGDDGRTYPWGNEEPNERLCNFGGNVGQTTPVTRYPDGASPYGVLDMAGNVWEWCLNPYDEPRSVDLAGDARRVLRGGSWFDYFRFARAASRFHRSPGLRDGNIGFRVLRPPSR